LLNCFKCKAEVVFDNEHIGKNGKKIPLDPATHAPHDCPMREKKSFVRQEREEDERWTEDVDDHGNETVYDMAAPHKQEYVDHTQPPKIKLKILTDPTPEGLALQYNNFQHNIKFSQYQIAGSLYTIAIYYEEIKQ